MPVQANHGDDKSTIACSPSHDRGGCCGKNKGLAPIQSDTLGLGRIFPDCPGDLYNRCLWFFESSKRGASGRRSVLDLATCSGGSGCAEACRFGRSAAPAWMEIDSPSLGGDREPDSPSWHVGGSWHSCAGRLLSRRPRWPGACQLACKGYWTADPTGLVCQSRTDRGPDHRGRSEVRTADVKELHWSRWLCTGVGRRLRLPRSNDRRRYDLENRWAVVRWPLGGWRSIPEHHQGVQPERCGCFLPWGKYLLCHDRRRGKVVRVCPPRQGRECVSGSQTIGHLLDHRHDCQPGRREKDSKLSNCELRALMVTRRAGRGLREDDDPQPFRNENISGIQHSCGARVRPYG